MTSISNAVSERTTAPIKESISAFQFGTDEAGYGPNLGPLVVAGTFWRSPTVNDDLFSRLSNVCSHKRASGRLHVADSKKVYSGNLRNLEEAVLSILCAWWGRVPTSLEDLLRLVEGNVDWESSEPIGFSRVSLPLVASVEKIKTDGQRLADEMRLREVELLRIRSSVVMPAEFNRLVDQFGNKASLLSYKSMGIVNELLEASATLPSTCRGVCDKHGGRNSYAGLLQELVTGDLIQTVCEGRGESRYCWADRNTNVDISFKTKGESFFATAVSSMVAKYIRELFMTGWNSFWCEQVAGLKPTKGYPVDAKRFKAEIEFRQSELGIADVDIWRCR